MNAVHSVRRRSRLFLTIGAVLALSALAVNAETIARWRHQVFPKRFGVVEPGRLYRSGQIAARLVRGVLKDHKIGMVIDLTDDNPTDPQEKADKQAELAAIEELGIERRNHVLLADGTGDVVVYAAAVKSVVDATKLGKPALVHCAAGTQRTGGVVALYRLFVQHRSPEEVLEEMESYKYNAKYSPNLLKYLNDNMEVLALELVRNGAIDEIPQNLPRLPDESLGSDARD